MNTILKRPIFGVAAVAAILAMITIGLRTTSDEAVMRAKLDSMAEELEALERTAEEPGCGLLQLDFDPVEAVEQVLNAVRASPNSRGISYLAARLLDLGRLLDAYAVNLGHVCSIAESLSREITSAKEASAAAALLFDSVLATLRPADDPWMTYEDFRKWLAARDHSDWERFRTETGTALHLSRIRGASPLRLYGLSLNIVRPAGLGALEYRVEYVSSNARHCGWRYFLAKRWGHRFHDRYEDEVAGLGVFAFVGPVSSSDRKTCLAPAPPRGRDRPIPSLLRQLAYALERELTRPCRARTDSPAALGQLFDSYRPNSAGTSAYDNAVEELTLRIRAEGEQICRLNSSTLPRLFDQAVATAYQESVGPREAASKLARARAQFVVTSLSRTLKEELDAGPFEIYYMGGAP